MQVVGGQHRLSLSVQATPAALICFFYFYFSIFCMQAEYGNIGCDEE